MVDGSEWVHVCPYDSIYPDTGVCALVDGRQVAVFRLWDGTLHALANHDPFSRANVLSRGIVGDRCGEPKVASPIYKQTFNLRTGQCYEDPSVRLDVFRVRRRNSVVEVFATPVDPSTQPELDDETLDGLGYSRT
jgi:nitrite reductase (NADH) small subunit